MRRFLRTALFFFWLAAALLFLLWYGFKLARMDRERAESRRKLEQRLEEVEKRALEVCKQAVELCNARGAKGCGSCQ
jgi:hypothetical protein